MDKNAKGALSLLVLGLLILLIVWFVWPILQNRNQRNTSDAVGTKGKIVVKYDNFFGYFPLCSPEMKKRMLAQGYLYECKDDGANYPERLQKIQDGETNIAVITVDSNILNGASLGMPGVMSIVLDESKGVDGFVSWQDKLPTIDSLKQRSDYKIAFTPQSPSHHLLKIVGIHFDVPQFLIKGPWRIETDGSTEALKKFLAREVDGAVLWEPELSQARATKGVVDLLDTSKTSGLIVDALLFSRNYSQSHGEEIQVFLSTYFRVLKMYREDPAMLYKDVNSTIGLSQEVVEKMVKGISWVNLADNCDTWFGIGSSGHTRNIIDVIESTVQILVKAGDFKDNPLPDGDPNRIIQSSHLVDLCTKGFLGEAEVGGAMVDSLSKKFDSLGDAGWNALREIGTLRAEHVSFQSGMSELTRDGKEKVDVMAENLRHYPNFRIIIKGHSNKKGDHDANKVLSEERAESVGRYLEVTYGIDPNRMRVVGFGGERALRRLPGESEANYQFRLQRVEFSLVTEVY